jgi:AhpD family alkylhydroperoxidase
MTRLSKLSVEELPEDIRELTKADDRTPLELGLTRIFAHRPELTKGMMPFSRALKVHRLLDNRLIELVRLRIAFFNQCRSCMAIRYPDALADGLTEDLVCSLEKPQEATNLTEREKLAVLYAEKFATDHLSIGDDLYARLKEHFTEPEIVELGFHCAFYVGFGRLAATWNMIEELPEEFQDMSHEVAPWEIADHVVMR